MKDITIIDIIDYFERILIDGCVIGTDFELNDDEKKIYEKTIVTLKTLI